MKYRVLSLLFLALWVLISASSGVPTEKEVIGIVKSMENLESNLSLPPLDRSELLSFAKKYRKGYGKFSHVVVVDRGMVQFNSKYQSVDYYEYAVLITSDAGVSEFSELKLGYDLNRSYGEIVFARVLKPDGTVREVDLSNVRESNPVSEQQMNIFYRGEVLKTLSLGAVEVGDVVWYAIRYYVYDPPYPFYDTLWYFDSSVPVRVSEFSLKVPEEEVLHWKVVNDEEGKVEFKKVGSLYSWRAESLSPIPDEPHAPPPIHYRRMLLASTVDWRGFSRLEYQLTEPSMKTDEAIKKEVERLVEGKENDWDKILAIFYYNAQKVRYLGVSHGEKEGFAPHPVTLTFHNQYGVCKDKAALLVAMLREAGFEAYNVLTTYDDDSDPDVAVDVFNHQIAALRWKGEWVYLDATDSLTKNPQPFYADGCPVLIATEEGEDLHWTPIRDPRSNGLRVSFKGRVEPDGKLKGTITFYADGGYHDAIFRYAFFYRRPEDRRKFVEQIVSALLKGGRVISYTFSPERPENLWEPVRLTINVEKDDYLLHLGELYGYKPVLAHIPSFWTMRSFFSAFALKRREIPLALTCTTEVDVDEEVQLPQGLEVFQIPPDRTFNSDSLVYKFLYSGEDSGFKMRTQVIFRKKELSPDEYAEARSGVKEISVKERQVVLLRRRGK